MVRPRGTLLLNYFLALISGLMWYGQYFGYGTGATKMGQYSFASWSIFMACDYHLQQPLGVAAEGMEAGRFRNPGLSCGWESLAAVDFGDHDRRRRRAGPALAASPATAAVYRPAYRAENALSRWSASCASRLHACGTPWGNAIRKLGVFCIGALEDMP